MAHVYIVTSISHLGDNAVVTGSVDAIPVSVNCNWSAITQQPNTASFQAFIAPLMLAQAIPPAPATDLTHNGTWTV